MAGLSSKALTVARLTTRQIIISTGIVIRNKMLSVVEAILALVKESVVNEAKNASLRQGGCFFGD